MGPVLGSLVVTTVTSDTLHGSTTWQDEIRYAGSAPRPPGSNCSGSPATRTSTRRRRPGRSGGPCGPEVRHRPARSRCRADPLTLGQPAAAAAWLHVTVYLEASVNAESSAAPSPLRRRIHQVRRPTHAITLIA